jgi:hypothetical protein
MALINKGEPLWSEGGQWPQMPVPDEFKAFCCGLCVPCLKGQLPFLRGIPAGSNPLPQAEKDALCARLAGHWQIQVLGTDPSAPAKNKTMIAGNPMVYTDMEIRGDSMFISGGMHNQTQSVGGGSDSHGNHQHSSTVTTAVVNKPQEQKIIPFRGTDGRLYVDNIGSFLEKDSDGEVEFNNGLGAKMLLQRGWKRSGLPNPNAVALVTGVVMGSAAPVGATMQRADGKVYPGNEDGPAEKIAKLKGLLDSGILTQEEFDKKKTDLLAQM